METRLGTRYLETSAVLAALLEQDGDAVRALRVPGHRVTSALTVAEANRAVSRARIAGRLSLTQERDALLAIQSFARRCTVVGVVEAILQRAGRPFPVEPVRTLDAIHLATAEALGEPAQLVTVVSRDARIRENAAALGYVVE